MSALKTAAMDILAAPVVSVVSSTDTDDVVGVSPQSRLNAFSAALDEIEQIAESEREMGETLSQEFQLISASAAKKLVVAAAATDFIDRAKGVDTSTPRYGRGDGTAIEALRKQVNDSRSRRGNERGEKSLRTLSPRAGIIADCDNNTFRAIEEGVDLVVAEERKWKKLLSATSGSTEEVDIEGVVLRSFPTVFPSEAQAREVFDIYRFFLSVSEGGGFSRSLATSSGSWEGGIFGPVRKFLAPPKGRIFPLSDTFDFLMSRYQLMLRELIVNNKRRGDSLDSVGCLEYAQYVGFVCSDFGLDFSEIDENLKVKIYTVSAMIPGQISSVRKPLALTECFARATGVLPGAEKPGVSTQRRYDMAELMCDILIAAWNLSLEDNGVSVDFLMHTWEKACARIGEHIESTGYEVFSHVTPEHMCSVLIYDLMSPAKFDVEGSAYDRNGTGEFESHFLSSLAVGRNGRTQWLRYVIDRARIVLFPRAGETTIEDLTRDSRARIAAAQELAKKGTALTKEERKIRRDVSNRRSGLPLAVLIDWVPRGDVVDFARKNNLNCQQVQSNTEIRELGATYIAPVKLEEAQIGGNDGEAALAAVRARQIADSVSKLSSVEVEP